MAREIELRGTVPISVVIDVDNGRVTAVHVWDEDVKVEIPTGDEERMRAVKRALDTEWPVWELG